MELLSLTFWHPRDMPMSRHTIPCKPKKSKFVNSAPAQGIFHYSRSFILRTVSGVCPLTCCLIGKSPSCGSTQMHVMRGHHLSLNLWAGGQYFGKDQPGHCQNWDFPSWEVILKWKRLPRCDCVWLMAQKWEVKSWNHASDRAAAPRNTDGFIAHIKLNNPHRYKIHLTRAFQTLSGRLKCSWNNVLICQEQDPIRHGSLQGAKHTKTRHGLGDRSHRCDVSKPKLGPGQEAKIMQTCQEK